ncbi:MAG: 3-methyl-2-oxobutanoate hydroxymethyltransferase, partial [Desulfobulbales bacterium]|nr:3-methyl-2-oxobutanoate hydroxymethyltransferase [Desulfobulbales bacterium]
KLVSEAVKVPIIGIGAGPDVDGQVLVTHDMIGMFEKFRPSFVKQYINLAPQIKEAVAAYNREVKEGIFPDDKQSFNMQLDVQSLLEK